MKKLIKKISLLSFSLMLLLSGIIVKAYDQDITITNNIIMGETLYSNIQKPIFFNDVKVQFMNDNVDIQPTLTFQSRSRNSYVMDMMKA